MALMKIITMANRITPHTKNWGRLYFAPKSMPDMNDIRRGSIGREYELLFNGMPYTINLKNKYFLWPEY